MILMVLLSNSVVKNIQASLDIMYSVFETVITRLIFGDFEEVKLGE